MRHEFDTDAGQHLGVIVHRDGRREVVVYDTTDPDACTSVLNLSAGDTRTVVELLGASQVSEAVAVVQQQIEGLAIEWIGVPAGSPAAGTTIGAGGYRSRTGASIVAVLRNRQTVPAPDPDFVFAVDDVAVAVGTDDGLASLRALLAPRGDRPAT